MGGVSYIWSGHYYDVCTSVVLQIKTGPAVVEWSGHYWLLCGMKQKRSPFRRTHLMCDTAMPHYDCNTGWLRYPAFEKFVTELKCLCFVGKVFIVTSAVNGCSYSVSVTTSGGNLVDVSTEAGVAGGFGLCCHNIWKFYIKNITYIIHKKKYFKKK